jgi:hypothetical protein
MRYWFSFIAYFLVLSGTLFGQGSKKDEFGKSNVQIADLRVRDAIIVSDTVAGVYTGDSSKYYMVVSFMVEKPDSVDAINFNIGSLNGSSDLVSKNIKVKKKGNDRSFQIDNRELEWAGNEVSFTIAIDKKDRKKIKDFSVYIQDKKGEKSKKLTLK